MKIIEYFGDLIKDAIEVFKRGYNKKKEK